MKSVFYVLGIISLGVVSVSCTTKYPSSQEVALEYVHAEGEDIGKPMDQLPVFTPQSGIGQGEPIYACPIVDLSFTLSPTNAAGIRSVFLRYLGGLYALVETVPGSLVFTDNVVSLTLSEPIPDEDFPRQKWTTASVTIPALGITHAVCPCIETSDDSSVFRNNLFWLVFTVGTQSNGLRTATLKMLKTGISAMSQRELFMETAIGTGIFTNDRLSVKLISIAGASRLSLTTTNGVYSNAIFSVWETAPQSGEYRNYHSPISTDLSEGYLKVPSFVPWQLKIRGLPDTFPVTQVTISTSVDSFSQITFSVVGDSLLSDQKFILIPDGPLEVPPPQGYVAIRTDTRSGKWSEEEQKDVSVQMTLQPLKKKSE